MTTRHLFTSSNPSVFPHITRKHSFFGLKLFRLQRKICSHCPCTPHGFLIEDRGGLHHQGHEHMTVKKVCLAKLIEQWDVMYLSIEFQREPDYMLSDYCLHNSEWILNICALAFAGTREKYPGCLLWVELRCVSPEGQELCFCHL